ncbi:MAG: hypothetical protein ACI8P3_000950 [Saprospiraceae bacterium]|jgi:hypothetical protein
MSSYISAELRNEVIKRAFNTCEYCLMHEDDAFFSFHIDHIISIKHGGTTVSENLAYSCPICNRDKGTDLGSFLDNPSKIIRFYNPRKDKWLDHFEIDNLQINAISEIGNVTLKILKLNDEHRILERELLIETGSFPSSFAKKLLGSSDS